MSFVVNLMYNHDPHNKISKSPSSVISLTGTLKEETSIVDPEILIEYAGTLTSCNYAYIPEFLRYYFIKDIENYRNNLWRVKMHCDVLKTFSEGILGSPCIVKRSSSDFNMMLNDPYFKTQQNPLIMTQTFPNGFDVSQASYVLALIGEAVPDE